MLLGQLQRGLLVLLQGHAVQSVLEDGLDRPVGDAPDLEGPLAGRLQTLAGAALPEAEDAAWATRRCRRAWPMPEVDG